MDPITDSAKNPLGHFLKAKRNEAGLSQAEVADKLGYSTSQFISNWERGLSAPPVTVLKNLADMYGVTHDEMLAAILDSAILRVTVSIKRKFYGKKTN